MRPITCKSILTKSRLPNVDYCFNPYVGCTHGCVYCYADFMRRFTGHTSEQWGKFVDCKENAAAVLRREIHKVSGGKSVLLGSVTDAYQPLEGRLGITRQCLEIFAENDANISILTKSALVARDIDILKRLTCCEVGISLGIANREYSGLLEPGASSPRERIEALEALHREKIVTYVFIGPIIPYITRLEDIFLQIKDCADYVMAEFLNLRVCNIHKLESRLESLLGEDGARASLNLCSRAETADACRHKYEMLCDKYHLQSKGFFSHS